MLAMNERQWHELNVGDKVSGLKKILDLQHTFALAYAAAGQPVDMAMFQSKNGSDEDAIMLFTPRAAAFASTVGAHPCRAPRRADVTLSFGDQRAWDISPWREA